MRRPPWGHLPFIPFRPWWCLIPPLVMGLTRLSSPGSPTVIPNPRRRRRPVSGQFPKPLLRRRRRGRRGRLTCGKRPSVGVMRRQGSWRRGLLQCFLLTWRFKVPRSGWRRPRIPVACQRLRLLAVRALQGWGHGPRTVLGH